MPLNPKPMDLLKKPPRNYDKRTGSLCSLFFFLPFGGKKSKSYLLPKRNQCPIGGELSELRRDQ
jgi:hypothetical protein